MNDKVVIALSGDYFHTDYRHWLPRRSDVQKRLHDTAREYKQRILQQSKDSGELNIAQQLVPPCAVYWEDSMRKSLRESFSEADDVDSGSNEVSEEWRTA